jgi:hypothetical protein
MGKKWVIGVLGVLVIVLGGFLYPNLAQSGRKVINFNAG